MTQTLHHNISPPTPAVEHLPTVFRRIRSGEYRVPPFQREFIWDEKQILELLESVYRGYPIGSALLWKVERKIFNTIKDRSVGFPVVTEAYPTSYVLDGVQRLSSLNGVFNRDEVSSDNRFQVHFDLENELFVHERDIRSSGVTIPLYTTFRPRDFLAQQSRLSLLENGDLFLERTLKLLAVFQEYMIPIVTIYNSDPRDVVNIFQRINSTGVRLGVVDFMRALTWSDDFDLSAALLELHNHFEERGFAFDDELLLKALGIEMGLKPLPDLLLALRERQPDELKDGITSLRANLESVLNFVTDEIGLLSSDALPYEAQWLLLFRLVSGGIDLTSIRQPLLIWIRTSSLAEALQGRPDHALVRMIEQIAIEVEHFGHIEPISLSISPQDLIFKRFLRGKAMTVAFISGLRQRGLFGEGPLNKIPYESFFPIVDRDALSYAFRREFSSARTIGNVVYMPNFVVSTKVSALGMLREVFSNGRESEIEMLRRQNIDEEFVRQIDNGEIVKALEYRAQSTLINTASVAL